MRWKWIKNEGDGTQTLRVTSEIDAEQGSIENTFLNIPSGYVLQARRVPDGPFNTVEVGPVKVETPKSAEVVTPAGNVPATPANDGLEAMTDPNLHTLAAEKSVPVKANRQPRSRADIIADLRKKGVTAPALGG